MYIDEIRDMDDEALLDELEDRKNELFKLRFQKTIGQLSDPNMIRFHKRVVARIKTVLHERKLARELAAAEGEDE